MKKDFKLMRWDEEGFPPIDLNESVRDVRDIIDEVKKLRLVLEASDKLITAMDQYSFFAEGYKKGAASISEVSYAGDDLDRAKSRLFEIIKKAKGL